MNGTGTSITLREARPGDETGLYELWRETFGDDDDYIDAFFHRFFSYERTVTALSGDNLVSAMYLLPAGTLYNGSDVFTCCYLYALSTLPDFEGRGIGTSVLESAVSHAFELGYDCAYLCPADEDLFPYYAERGFRPFSSCGETSYIGMQSVSPLKLESVTAEEYAERREQFLEDIPHIDYSPDMLGFQQALCRAEGADMWSFNDGVVCAEISDDGRYAVIKELLCDDGLRGAVINSVMTKCGVGMVRCRFPYSGSGNIQTGLARFRDDRFAGNVWSPFLFD